MEALLLHAGPVRTRPRGERRAESRQLPRECARPLRRMPYPAQFPRRAEAQPPSRRGEALGEGAGAQNLTPARLKKKSDAQVKDFLLTGMTPDGDVAAESMAEVVRNTT